MENDGVAAPLFEGHGAFAIFSARIDTAYLLGLLPSSARLDLHLVRKIRNDFAHLASPLGFDDEKMAARCRELRHVRAIVTAPRKRFIQATMGLAAVIVVQIRRIAEGSLARCQACPERGLPQGLPL